MPRQGHGGGGNLREQLYKKPGYGKNATVLLLTVAFLFWRWGAVPARAERNASVTPADVLVAGLTDSLNSIDLRGVSLPVADLGGVYQAILLDHPELFHVVPRLSYGYAETVINGVTVRTVTEVYPVYTLTGEELTAARALYRETVAALLAEMDAAFGAYHRTEADIVLYLHDRLADCYAYDLRAEENPYGETNTTAYTLFRDGVGVCQAYALAFLALCRGAGLDAHTVVSDAMDHAWNHVRVDGVWYHVDVTRDDPIPAEGGTPTVTHTRLLRSDGGMDAMGYHGYSCPMEHSCADTRYETAEGRAGLENVTQGMRFWGEKWLGMGESGAVMAVKLQKNGIMTGQVGDANMDGAVDPRDLLAVYDPDLPEAWREWMRGEMVE